MLMMENKGVEDDVNNDVETADQEDEAEMSRDTGDDLKNGEAFDEAIDALIHQ